MEVKAFIYYVEILICLCKIDPNYEIMPTIIMIHYYRATEFPSSLKQEKIVSGSKEGSCHSIPGSKCSCLVLPQWILDHPDMIFSNNSIKKISVLGSGQFGTVYKGTFTQGHAV